jgi:hypothetical protein
MTIRRPFYSEYPAIRDLIRTVVTEIYGDLWDITAMPNGDEDWSTGWIAVDGADVIGVLLTTSDWIDDLWIMRSQEATALGPNFSPWEKQRLLSADSKSLAFESSKRISERCRSISITGGRLKKSFSMSIFQ